MEGDPRLIPARPDLAALHLKGAIEAEAYAPGADMRVSAPMAPLTASRDAEGEMTSQLLFGEVFTVYETDGGWCWGQCDHDGYVGYVPEAMLGPAEPAPTHRISALQALVYPEPAVRARPIAALPFGAEVAIGETEGAFVGLAIGGFIPASAVRPIGDDAQLWVSTAQRFLGAPYLWGGRSPAGFDCSGLVQVALASAGKTCPRDSDQQFQALGRPVPLSALRRGDLVFWRGHVGVMTSPSRLLHANAHHMAVAEESFDAARARIAAGEYGDIIGARRISK